jgi:hypothetical protein
MVGKRGRKEVDIDEDDFIENDDGYAPKSKKSKKAQGSKSSSEGADKSWEVNLIPSICKTIADHTSYLPAEPQNEWRSLSSKVKNS